MTGQSIRHKDATVKCDFCGKEVAKFSFVLKRHTHHFCDNKCQWEWRRKTGEMFGENAPWYNQKEVPCQHCGKIVSRNKYRIEHSKNMFCSASCRMKHYMYDRLKEGTIGHNSMKKPTSIEKAFMLLIQEYNLPFKYVGTGKFWIGTYNPDFIHNSKKIAIEIFGSYWHSPLFNPKVKERQTINKRTAEYKKADWDCIVIWDYELKNTSAVLKKVGGIK